MPFFFNNAPKNNSFILDQCVFNYIFSSAHGRRKYETGSHPVISWSVNLPQNSNKAIELFKTLVNFKTYINRKMRESMPGLSLNNSDYDLGLMLECVIGSAQLSNNIDSSINTIKPMLENDIDCNINSSLIITLNEKMHAQWIQPHLDITLEAGENLIELLDTLYSSGHRTLKLA